MRFYVATKFENFKQAREVAERLKRLGHEPTCEWYSNPEEFDEAGNQKKYLSDLPRESQLACAIEDFEGARDCDFLVLLDYDRMVGAYVEVGIALAHHNIIHVVGNVKDTVFWRLANVFRHKDIEEFFTHFVPLTST